VFTFVLLITFSSSAQEVYISNEGKGLLQLLNLNSTPAAHYPVYGRGQARRLDPKLRGPTHLLGAFYRSQLVRSEHRTKHRIGKWPEVGSRFGNRTRRADDADRCLQSWSDPPLQLCHRGDHRTGQGARDLRWHRLRPVWNPKQLPVTTPSSKSTLSRERF
jgi:hypothetical protein